MTSHRVALFTDTFHEVNGVALTCRQFAAFAEKRKLPFLRVHPGPQQGLRAENGQRIFELPPSRASIGFEADLRFDLLFLRHRAALRAALERFQPTVIHVTAPGHCSILGVALAHELGIPLAASWHTNVHEFGARRLAVALDAFPKGAVDRVESAVQSIILKLACRFYRIARLLFAPNPELRQMLQARTGKPVYPMHRGVDLGLFHPRPGARSAGAPLTIGYVGRLTPEKNVRLLRDIEQTLSAEGIEARFLIVGQGSERSWLESNLRNAVFPGVLRGEALAEAYSSLDIFAFPSETDTYGNVVQEAKACGVPAVVTSGGGPKYLVHHEVDGLVTSNPAEFIASVRRLAQDRILRERMSAAALAGAQSLSWDAVFESVYSAYGELPERSESTSEIRRDRTTPLPGRRATVSAPRR